MGSPTPPPSGRVRISCDACSGSKVKCDKKHPSCERCINNHLKCTYSISRRHGKQSWQKKLASEREKALTASPATPDIATYGSIPLAGASNSAPSLLSGQTWNQPTYSALVQTTPAQPFVPPQDLFRFDDFLEPMLFWPQVELPSNFGFPDLEAPSVQPDIDVQIPIAPASSINQQVSHEPHTYSSLSSDTITDPPRHRTRSRYQQAYNNKIHDCEARAIAVLRSLHHHYSRPSLNNQRDNASQEAMMTVGGTGPEKPPVATPNTIPTFDQVLLANKLALGGWSELMECSCTRCPHLGFLYVSIISKVLFWYRVVAARMYPLPNTEQSENDGDTASQQANTLDVPPEFKIRLPTIQIGILELDPEDQANLRRVMLLRELRRVDEAIAAMANMKHVTENDPAAYHAAQWLQLGISRVRDQLQEVVHHVEQVSKK